MRNLHKYYYKNYFSPEITGVDLPGSRLSFEYLDNEKVKDKGKDIISKRNQILTETSFAKNEKGKPLKDELIIINDASPVAHRFTLTIAYPGLVTGIGIEHEAKIEGEFKLGVHFDWTYGMPVIYGSSVKGVLRNAFIAKVEKGKITKYEDYYLKKITKEEWEPEAIEILFNSIFEGKDYDGKDQEGKIQWKNKSIYDRDIFFDAVIIKADPKGRILCSDSITPHGDNPLKNPIPITFLKIAPGCQLEFRFKLTDTVINGVPFTAAQKLALFKEILTTVGVGAKTNVGYGQLKST